MSLNMVTVYDFEDVQERELEECATFMNRASGNSIRIYHASEFYEERDWIFMITPRIVSRLIGFSVDKCVSKWQSHIIRVVWRVFGMLYRVCPDRYDHVVHVIMCRKLHSLSREYGKDEAGEGAVEFALILLYNDSIFFHRIKTDIKLHEGVQRKWNFVYNNLRVVLSMLGLSGVCHAGEMYIAGAGRSS